MVLEAPPRPSEMFAITPLPALYGDGCHELTVEDWWALPEDGRQYELLDGMLTLMPPPNLRHQLTLTQLIIEFGLYARRFGGVAAVAPLGVALSSKIGFEPDLVYVSPGREEILSERGVEGVPDIVVEIVSPSTQTYDRDRKLPIYLALGVREVWLVDPKAATVTVHTASYERAVAFGETIPSAIVDIGAGGLSALV